MTTTFLVGEALRQRICDIVANGPGDLAVAYWGAAACERLSLPADLTDFRIACDAFSGNCSPTTIQTLLERGAKVFAVEGLHAKLYSCAKGMVVTSANASGRGLRDDPPGLEVGLFHDDPDTLAAAARWFETILGDRVVEVDDLEELRRLWRPYGVGRPIEVDLAHAILTVSPILDDLDLGVYVYPVCEPGAAEEQAYRASKHFDATGYENGRYYPYFWGEMPAAIRPGATLLCFETDAKTVSCEGVWTIRAEVLNDRVTIWPSVHEHRPFGRALGDAAALTARVAKALDQEELSPAAQPTPVKDFARAIARAEARRAAVALEGLANGDVIAAGRYLLESAAVLGFDLEPYRRGKVSVRWRDRAGRYVFSFIVNRGDLLFYIRRPALEAWPDLKGMRQLPLTVQSNPRGEITMRIASLSDAKRLMNGLKSHLSSSKPVAPSSKPPRAPRRTIA